MRGAADHQRAKVWAFQCPQISEQSSRASAYRFHDCLKRDVERAADGLLVIRVEEDMGKRPAVVSVAIHGENAVDVHAYRIAKGIIERNNPHRLSTSPLRFADDCFPVYRT